LSVTYGSWWGVLDTTVCNKVCQWPTAGRWFSPGTPVSSTNKTDSHNITEIQIVLLSVFKHHSPQYFELISSFISEYSGITIAMRSIGIIGDNLKHKSNSNKIVIKSWDRSRIIWGDGGKWKWWNISYLCSLQNINVEKVGSLYFMKNPYLLLSYVDWVFPLWISTTVVRYIFCTF
jgi:hypothetical protein